MTDTERARRAAHYEKNRELILQKARDRYAANREAKKTASSTYYKKNGNQRRAQMQQWRERNPEKVRDSNRAYYAEHKQDVTDSNRDYRARNRKQIAARRAVRRKSDPVYRLTVMVRNAIARSLKDQSAGKAGKSFELLGCSGEEYFAYLTGLLGKGMTWENYGIGGWVIDHIRPICSFDLRILEQQAQAFHFSNTQPMWELDNLLKGGTWKQP